MSQIPIPLRQVTGQEQMGRARGRSHCTRRSAPPLPLSSSSRAAWTPQPLPAWPPQPPCGCRSTRSRAGTSSRRIHRSSRSLLPSPSAAPPAAPPARPTPPAATPPPRRPRAAPGRTAKAGNAHSRQLPQLLPEATVHEDVALLEGDAMDWSVARTTLQASKVDCTPCSVVVYSTTECTPSGGSAAPSAAASCSPKDVEALVWMRRKRMLPPQWRKRGRRLSVCSRGRGRGGRGGCCHRGGGRAKEGEAGRQLPACLCSRGRGGGEAAAATAEDEPKRGRRGGGYQRAAATEEEGEDEGKK